MVNKVVATKLTEEEHSKLIDFCTSKGVTPSAVLRKAVIERINPVEKPKEIESIETKEEPKNRDMSLEELAEKFGVKKIPKDKPDKIELERPKPTLEETLDHMKNCKNPNCKYGKKNLMNNLNRY